MPAAILLGLLATRCPRCQLRPRARRGGRCHVCNAEMKRELAATRAEHDALAHRSADARHLELLRATSRRF